MGRPGGCSIDLSHLLSRRRTPFIFHVFAQYGLARTRHFSVVKIPAEAVAVVYGKAFRIQKFYECRRHIAGQAADLLTWVLSNFSRRSIPNEETVSTCSR